MVENELGGDGGALRLMAISISAAVEIIRKMIAEDPRFSQWDSLEDVLENPFRDSQDTPSLQTHPSTESESYGSSAPPGSASKLSSDT